MKYLGTQRNLNCSHKNYLLKMLAIMDRLCVIDLLLWIAE